MDNEFTITDNAVWIDVKNYEGLYQINQSGEIKSGNKILKPGVSIRGYYQVSLYKDGNKKTAIIHKLVATHFLPNIKKLPCVNHKDGNKLNNKAENLEWCTYSHNIQHAFDSGLKMPSNGWRGKTGKLHCRSKAVIQKTLDGVFVRRWDSIRDIQRELGFLNNGISNCLNGRSQKSYGFKWSFEN